RSGFGLAEPDRAAARGETRGACPASATTPPTETRACSETSRIPWAELLLRVLREDVLLCPCGGRRVCSLRHREECGEGNPEASRASSRIRSGSSHRRPRRVRCAKRSEVGEHSTRTYLFTHAGGIQHKCNR